MSIPRFLLGLALLFWGYEIHGLLVAIPLAIAVELPHFINARWEFSAKDLNRIWDLCTVLLLAIGLIIATTNDAARASFQFIQWVPVGFVPIIAAQLYGSEDALRWSVFSWFLRRSPNTPAARRRINITWIYFAICLFAASATHDANAVFYPGMCVLVAAALYSVRPKRVSLVPWFVLLICIGVTGSLTSHGLFRLQAKVQSVFDEWIADFLKRDPDQRESRTSIGKSGKIKLSGKIVLRVHPEGSPLPPSLLRESTYDFYAKGVWRMANNQSGSVFVGIDENAQLLPKKQIRYSVRIGRYVNVGIGPLPLPQGTYALHELGTMQVLTNRLGFARFDGGGNFANYVADYGPGDSFDAPPSTNAVTGADLDVPPTEKETLHKIAAELNVQRMSNFEKMEAVQQYFRSNFKYSVELLARATTNKTALASFLTDVRAGHCEYFATASTLLLRELKVPARYCTGFAVQPTSRSGSTYLVRARHSHAWTLSYNDQTQQWLEVDATPPNWDEINSGDSSPWEPFSDFFSNLYFQFSKWRWGKFSIAAYLPWLVLPLIGIFAWRIVHQQTRKRAVTPPTTEETPHAWPGLDSEFFKLERKLNQHGLGRQPTEPLLHWRDRLGRELPQQLNVDHIFVLHRRLRFDPNGLTTEERAQLRSEVTRWLFAFAALRETPPNSQN